MPSLRKTIITSLRSEGGNIAILFALCLTLLVGGGGMAIDYAIRQELQSDIQQAADSAALAAMSPYIDNSKREAVARKQFHAELENMGLKADIDMEVDLSTPNYVRVDAAVDIPTKFAKLLGFPTMSVAVLSEVGRSFKQPEIVFVLDVSGSMSGSRITNLKTAAKRLIDMIETNAPPGVDPLYGIVPFTENVNIGIDNARYVTGADHPLFDGTKWLGCVLERRSPHTNSDSYSGSDIAANGKWRAYISPPEPYDGATNACQNPSNGTNDGYSVPETHVDGNFSSQYNGPNFNCVRHSLNPLNGNALNIKTAIDALTAEANNGTVIAPGVGWGMRLLTPGEPFKEAKEFSENVHKIMIVLTDGAQTTEAEYGGNSTCPAAANTTDAYEYDPKDFGLDGKKLSGAGPRDLFTPWGYILDSDPFKSNPLDFDDVHEDLKKVSLEACENAKDAGTGPHKGIEVYSIAVSTAAGPGTDVYELLSTCASSEGHMLYAETIEDLEPTFEQIAEQILSIHLSK